VLEPVSRETFLTEHWERRPLLVQRAQACRFDDLFSEGEFERLVCSTAIRHPAFRLVREGEQIPLARYTEEIPWRPAPFTETAAVERVLAEWQAGATIVLQALHLSHEPLARFCRALELELGQPVQVNAYATPRTAQGFAVHHDTHDVFVLQVAGRKRWLVYEPKLELPLKQQRYSARLGPPGEPVEDFVLEAGDTLYLPRGWLHEALTSDNDSLHLTVGVNVVTWADAVRDALEACGEELAFRRGVPTDGEGAAELLELLAERLRPREVVARLQRRLVQSRRPLLDGQLTQLRALERLGLESEVERRPGVLFELSGCALRFHGKTVSVPERVADELAFVATASGRFRSADLPGELDAAGRLVLVRRLVREGFLRVCEPRSDGDASRPERRT
jgi:ribosomal protein L16 Arg81 hydroxylase